MYKVFMLIGLNLIKSCLYNEWTDIWICVLWLECDIGNFVAFLCGLIGIDCCVIGKEDQVAKNFRLILRFYIGIRKTFDLLEAPFLIFS